MIINHAKYYDYYYSCIMFIAISLLNEYCLLAFACFNENIEITNVLEILENEFKS